MIVLIKWLWRIVVVVLLLWLLWWGVSWLWQQQEQVAMSPAVEAVAERSLADTAQVVSGNQLFEQASLVSSLQVSDERSDTPAEEDVVEDLMIKTYYLPALSEHLLSSTEQIIAFPQGD